MRDTLITITLLGAVIGGYFYFTDGRIAPNIGKPAASTPSQAFVWENQSNGGKNDRRHQKSGRGQGEADFQSGEIDSGDREEIQRITSIYPAQKRSRSAKLGKSGTAGTRKQRKVVHGVPLQAFAESQRDRIDFKSVPGPNKEGLRVYLQCMELREKGTTPLQENECDRLLVGNLEQKQGVRRHLVR